jgi:hypothetical protein
VTRLFELTVLAIPEFVGRECYAGTGVCFSEDESCLYFGFEGGFFIMVGMLCVDGVSLHVVWFLDHVDEWTCCRRNPTYGR